MPFSLPKLDAVIRAVRLSHRREIAAARVAALEESNELLQTQAIQLERQGKAAREMAEELSIVVSPDDLALQRRHTIVDPAAQQVTVVVAVTLRDRPVVDGAEVVEARWFAEADLPTPLVRGTYESLEITGVVQPSAAR